MRTKSYKTLLSFVGTNDQGKLKGDEDGAILTTFRERSFDEVHLLWNPSNKKEINYKAIADYVAAEIKNRGLCDRVSLHEFPCADVTDHNLIYPQLLSLCKSLGTGSNKKFTAAIASGTPAMQVCWILLAESGDFPIELVRSKEPRFGKPYVSVVKLGTTLPKIIRLQEEKKELERQKDEILPKLVMDVNKGTVQIGTANIALSPIEFAYYRYFIERAKDSQEPQRFSGITVSMDFLKTIVRFHKESFPDAELFRLELEKMLREGRSLYIGTFRANITKANSKITKALENPALAKVFQISRYGKRHAVDYGIQIPSTKITIKSSRK
jgi:hypothetical protein